MKSDTIQPSGGALTLVQEDGQRLTVMVAAGGFEPMWFRFTRSEAVEFRDALNEFIDAADDGKLTHYPQPVQVFGGGPSL